MRLRDRLTGTHRPVPEVVPQGWEAVRSRLLALNRPDAAFVVRDGAPDGVDLVCEWRIQDHEWREYFQAVGMARTFQVLMRARSDARQLRSIDQQWVVRWAAGVPELVPAREVGRGQMPQVERTWTVGRGSNGRVSMDEGPTFSSRELKSPLRDVVTQAGWTWRGVLWGRV